MYVKVIEADICIIGGGVGGLTMASVSAQLGLNVVLFEGFKMGGDCLNVGCVPSKSLLAAGHAAHISRYSSKQFGVSNDKTSVDMQAVHDHIHGVIKTIEPHDSPERFEGMGVRVIKDHARFIDKKTVEGGDLRVKARKFVIATGSAPVIPDIPGIGDVTAYTNEKIFELTTLPDHLLIIGAGPIGSEMAQAFKQLGAKVSVISHSSLLPHDDPEAVEVIRKQFNEDGIKLYEKSEVKKVSGRDGNIKLELKTADGNLIKLEGSDLLVATGQKPNISGLDLDKAGVTYSDKGIEVNNSLRTSNKNIYAVGDCTGQHQFTHIAEYHTSIVIQKLLFKSPFAKVNYNTLPWVTYTSPELAQIGMNETQAEEQLSKEEYKILRFNYADNDRARTERQTDGFIKVIATPKGHVLGATIVGKNAGELILPWSLAISKKLKLKDIAGQIVPYPTYNEISKRAASGFYKDQLFSDMTKKVVNFLKHF